MMLKLDRLYYTSKEFDLLASLKMIINYLRGIKLQSNLRPHHFLYPISEKYYKNFKPLFMAKSTFKITYDFKKNKIKKNPFFYLIDFKQGHITTSKLARSIYNFTR
jgi:hypothetical protein